MTEYTKAFDIMESEQIYRNALQSNQKLKFLTTNFEDLNEAKDKYNYHGINIKGKLFVPSEDINAESLLKFGIEGNQNTNFRVKTQLGQLPLLTMPYRYGAADGDLAIENELRDYTHLRDTKGSIPFECNLFDRSFSVFSKEVPHLDPINGIESVANFGPRGGYPTRLDDHF